MADDLGIRYAFVKAYPEYVARLLVDRGVEIGPTVADGIVAGTEVLDALMAVLEESPPAVARRSPLELFREALRPVSDALDAAGVEYQPSDETQRALLPWDRHGLSPGSARLISEEAHEAHLRWGLAKAQAHAVRPTAGLRCSPDDAPRLLEQFNALGYRVVRLPSDEPVSVALLSMGATGVDHLVSSLSAAGAHVIVFSNDPDDLDEARFRSLGATAVLGRREVSDDLASHVPTLV